MGFSGPLTVIVIVDYTFAFVVMMGTIITTVNRHTAISCTSTATSTMMMMKTPVMITMTIFVKKLFDDDR